MLVPIAIIIIMQTEVVMYSSVVNILLTGEEGCQCYCSYYYKANRNGDSIVSFEYFIDFEGRDFSAIAVIKIKQTDVVIVQYHGENREK